MLLRSIRRRAALCGVTTAVLVGLTTGGLTAPAAATPDAFRPQLVTVDTPSRADKQLLQTLGLDLTEHAGHDYVEVVLHTPEDVAALTGAGLGYDVRIPDLVAREAENNQVNAAYAAATVRSPLPSGRDTYRTLDDYNADMTALAEQHPDLVKLFTLPHPSLDGRPIYGVEIGRGVQGPERGLPVFLMLGVHHAREWPSGEHAMEFAVDLVTHYGTDRRITDLVNRSRVVVVPVVNVDGFDMSRTDGELVDLRAVDEGGTASILGTPGNAYKRKNCRIVDGQDTPDGTCAVGRHQPRRLRGRRRPEPQLRRLLGRPRRLGPVRRPHLPRRGGVLRAGDAEHPRADQRPAGDHADHQPHLLEPGAPAERRRPRPGARERGHPAGRPVRRGRAAGARRRDGRAERLREPARVGALRHHRLHGGLVVQRHRRLRLHLRDRPGRVPSAVPGGGRRVPRRRAVRRPGQPGGVPDRAGERRRPGGALGAHRPGAGRRDPAAEEDLRLARPGTARSRTPWTRR